MSLKNRALARTPKKIIINMDLATEVLTMGELKKLNDICNTLADYDNNRDASDVVNKYKGGE